MWSGSGKWWSWVGGSPDEMVDDHDVCVIVGCAFDPNLVTGMWRAVFAPPIRGGLFCPGEGTLGGGPTVPSRRRVSQNGTLGHN